VSLARQLAHRGIDAAKIKVLVVEDDEELRRMLVEGLESDGAEVWDVANGALAERLLFEDGVSSSPPPSRKRASRSEPPSMVSRCSCCSSLPCETRSLRPTRW